MRLGDVANLTIGTQALSGDAVVNGGPGLLMIVEKYPWGNTLQVTRDVDKAVKELQPGLPGVTIDTHIFRAENFINVSIDNLTRALLIGALLVILVLFVFLFEWRTALISTVAIPLSLTAAGLVLYWRGDTINVMVLAGLVIALGVVVDDAIIDIENIWRRLRQNRAEGNNTPIAKVIVEASLEVRSSIVYATMIILLSLIPIYLLSGLTGTFFRPLVLSYGLAVGASLLVALTITPALSMLLLSRAPLKQPGPTARGVAEARLRMAALARDPPAAARLPRRPPDSAGRACGRAVPRGVAGADVQGAQLPRALHHQAGHVAHRGDAHDRARPARPEEGPGRRSTWAPTSGRPSWRTRSQA